MQACVFMGMWEYKSLGIFGARPAGGKEGKLPSAAFSPPVSFRNTKGCILVPACLLFILSASIYKCLLPSSCHPRPCPGAPQGWLLGWLPLWAAQFRATASRMRLRPGPDHSDTFSEFLLLELAGQSNFSSGPHLSWRNEWVSQKESELRERNKRDLEPGPPRLASYIG